MPIFHNYESDYKDSYAEANTTEVSHTLPDPFWLDFQTHLQTQALNPLTLCSAAAVGILAQSKRKVLLFSVLLGIATAAYHNQHSFGAHDFLAEELAQILCTTLLSFVCYGLKRGWQALNKAQQDMDDCDSYVEEMNNPELVDKTPRHFSPEPVTQKATINFKTSPKGKQKRVFKPYRLNLIQKLIVSGMLPVLTITGLKALTASMMKDDSEYWWIWLTGLSLLLIVELWFWRGKTNKDKE